MSRKNVLGEDLYQTVIRSRSQNSLLLYSLVKDEVIELGINGKTPEGVEIEPSRVITARALGLKTEPLEVIGDTSVVENWAGRTLSLGSYVVSGIAIRKLSTPTIVRGLLAYGGGVAIDFSGENFEGQMAATLLMAEYESLSLQDQKIL